MNNRLLFLVNVDWFFLSHRLPVALEAMKQGYDVHIATGITNRLDELLSYGFHVHPVRFSRNKIGIVSLFQSLFDIIRVVRTVKPVIVHAVTLKPVILGGIISRLFNVPCYVAAISGLGTLFVDGHITQILLRTIITPFYRFALGHPKSAVIFQNPDDKDVLLEAKVINHNQIRLIRGSGVDLNEYSYQTEPAGKVVITMASRLLRDKGVREFCQASQKLQARNVPVEFRLIGSVDKGNQTSISEIELSSWVEEGAVTYMGFRNDIAKQYSLAHIICLPSYYREGLPKCLVEAAACGRPVVTTDVPGCRDAIIPGQTGFLVPPKDSDALANAIFTLVKDSGLRRSMGCAGRQFAEREFSIEKIVAEHLAIYEELRVSS